MIVKRRGGMCEYIPSPQEKREGLIRDHTLNLIDNLHLRLERLEQELGMSLDQADDFSKALEKIRDDEHRNRELHNDLISKGSIEIITN